MLEGKRSFKNPILRPDPTSAWESEAVYNPSPVVCKGMVHLLYRAIGKAGDGQPETSSIGVASGKDGVHFKDRRQFIVPEHPWEQMGCEDPRVTEFEGRLYVFYTAVESFSADGIKVGLAISDDLRTIKEKHLVTPFNAKAMALFPERINGKIAAILTVNTDRPPARIAIALFDRIEDIWSEKYWEEWYGNLGERMVSIDVNEKDQVEVGSAPLKTEKGWLLFYSYIYNYFAQPAIFGVQALLLDEKDPRKIVGEVKRPFLVPEEEYEQYGRVPRIVFPSGAIAWRSNMYLYYGAADTTSCLAVFKLKDLLEELVFVRGASSRGSKRIRSCADRANIRGNRGRPSIPERSTKAGKCIFSTGRCRTTTRRFSATRRPLTACISPNAVPGRRTCRAPISSGSTFRAAIPAAKIRGSRRLATGSICAIRRTTATIRRAWRSPLFPRRTSSRKNGTGRIRSSFRRPGWTTRTPRFFRGRSAENIFFCIGWDRTSGSTASSPLILTARTSSSAGGF